LEQQLNHPKIKLREDVEEAKKEKYTNNQYDKVINLAVSLFL
jgi:hypothetical protein